MTTCKGHDKDDTACGSSIVQDSDHCCAQQDQTTRAKAAAPAGKPKLTREDVLKMIEENGGPEGLDLSHCDLSGIDLGSVDFFKSTLRVYRDETAALPAWVYHEDEMVGVSLCGANLNYVNFRDASLRAVSFEDAKLRQADLEGADCWKAIFRRAYLRRANFRNTYLKDTSFQKAYIGRCTFESADLENADLYGADLNASNLTNAFLLGANLRDANLRGTILLNAKLRRDSIGECLLFEKELPELRKRFSDQRKRYSSGIGFTGHEGLIPQRHAVARDIYTSLKNNFTSLGQYADASWTYIRERQKSRMTKAPWRARQYYGQAHPFGLERLPTYQSLSRRHPLTWWFWFKYTVKWLLDWVTELSCGYGERPLRTIAVAGLILVIFPLIYWATAGVGWFDPALGRDVLSHSFLDYVIYSAGAFATIGYEGLKAVNTAARIWTAVEALLGISILALLMFTLGNRIGRS